MANEADRIVEHQLAQVYCSVHVKDEQLFLIQYPGGGIFMQHFHSESDRLSVDFVSTVYHIPGVRASPPEGFFACESEGVTSADNL